MIRSVFIIFCFCLCGLSVRARPVPRPYEFDWANRTRDEFPPVARLESADGWHMTATNVAVKFETAKDPTGKKIGNGLHATIEGGKAAGDAIFAWLLADLSGETKEERK